MKIHIVIVLIILILFFIIYTFIYAYNKFQDFIIKINEVESKIDECLRNKFDIIIKLNSIIKEKIKTNKALVDDINELKDVQISSFEMDRKLNEAMSKVNFVKEKYEVFEGDEDTIRLIYEIEDIDESLLAFKKYYNECITEYNVLIKKIPYLFIGKYFKYSEKKYFDGKDMNDENIDDFKI